MSYREENGQVVLTMSREDYEMLLIVLGYAAGGAVQVFELTNRLNQGNPNFTPYQVEAQR